MVIRYECAIHERTRVKTLMFQLNWKIKSLIYQLLSYFNLYKTLFYIQKKITKRSIINYENEIFYWDYHLKYLIKNNSRTILEIGAGKSLAQNIYLSYKLNKNTEQTLIDISKMLDIDLFNVANEKISKLLKVDRKPFAKNINDLKKNFNLNYLAPMKLNQIYESGAQFDACISSATLEHLPKNELLESFKILKKIIKKNGIISAVIDYSDHYSHTDKKISNLNYLQFSDSEWNRYNTPMLYQNRLRHQDYKKIFNSTGYEIFEIKGNYGICPKKISDKFDMSNKDTLLLWGYFLLKL